MQLLVKISVKSFSWDFWIHQYSNYNACLVWYVMKIDSFFIFIFIKKSIRFFRYDEPCTQIINFIHLNLIPDIYFGIHFVLKNDFYNNSR